MTPHHWLNPGLRDVFRLGIRQVYAYRMWMYLGVLQVFLHLVLMRAVWQAVYGTRSTVDGVAIETMIVYLTIVALLNFMIFQSIADEIHRRIDQGQVAVDMLRPIGFVRQMVAINMGNAVGRWLALIIVVPGLVLIGSLTPPSPDVIILFAISFMLGFAVSTLVSLLVGLSGFWLINISGMSSMIGLVSSLLSGSMIPVWFMPGPLRLVVEWLPFQATTYLPASIYVEHATGWEMWRALGVQLLWVVLLGLAAALIWQRARIRLVVQGG